MSKDISKQTVVVLAILAILVSILGTFTVLNEVSNMHVIEYTPEDTPSQSGFVKIAIKGEPQVSASTGQVTMQITNTI